MPIVEIRKITIAKKDTDYPQYLLTIPKSYGDTLTTLGINEFLLILNSFGGILVPLQRTIDTDAIKRRALEMLPKIADLLNLKEVSKHE